MFAACVIIPKNQFHYLCSSLTKQSAFRPRYVITRSVNDGDKSEVRRKQWLYKTLKAAFGKYLLVTNTLSSGILMALGDLFQQEIEYVNKGAHQNSFDWKRNRNMFIVGLFQGPFTHYFYQILDKHLPGVKLSTIVKKIALDQTIASPFCIILFFLGMNYLNEDSFETSTKELKNKFWKVFAADCTIWIPTQFINFCLLPTEYRVIYINLVTMGYNVFLSFMKHKESSF